MGFESQFWILTWLVQTLLKDTNAKVCASMVAGRSFLARMKGNAKADRKIWGINAADSRRMIEGFEIDEPKYKRVL
jgi:hypothetical protein